MNTWKEERGKIWSDVKIWLGGVIMKKFFSTIWDWIKGPGLTVLKVLVISKIEQNRELLKTQAENNLDKLIDKIIEMIRKI